jgi:ribonuclease HII
MFRPNLKEEKNLWKQGFRNVVGLDEAGRGPLAGPVLAAAVSVNPKRVLKLGRLLKEVNDSKKLSALKRERLFKEITKHSSIQWGLGKVSEKIIDRINVFKASQLAMKKALKQIKKPDFLILDGNFRIPYPLPQKPIVKADQKVFSCAAASIIAKVSRDRIMDALGKKYPRYSFKKHKGYPTKLHFKELSKHGPSKIHRKSFGPVKACKIR